ncbi:unnamed protein product [Effrenium voratum]|nr:unnamed protein product [Effrenium voratum]
MGAGYCFLFALVVGAVDVQLRDKAEIGHRKLVRARRRSRRQLPVLPAPVVAATTAAPLVVAVAPVAAAPAVTVAPLATTVAAEEDVQAKRRPIVRKHAKEDVSEEDGEKEEKEDEQDGKDENNEKSDSHEKNEKAQPQADWTGAYILGAVVAAGGVGAYTYLRKPEQKLIAKEEKPRRSTSSKRPSAEGPGLPGSRRGTRTRDASRSSSDSRERRASSRRMDSEERQSPQRGSVSSRKADGDERARSSRRSKHEGQSRDSSRTQAGGQGNDTSEVPQGPAKSRKSKAAASENARDADPTEAVSKEAAGETADTPAASARPSRLQKPKAEPSTAGCQAGRGERFCSNHRFCSC